MNDDLYYCDDDMHYTYELVEQSNLTDLVLLPLFGLFIFLFILESALLFRLPYIFRRTYALGRLSNNEKNENKVTIVRGVPGAGKKYYVYHLEKDNDSGFALCDWNEYFVDSEGEYKFKGSELGRAEQYSRLKFIRAIAEKVKRIYVVGYFSESWTYYEYEKLAKVSGYNVEVVDIECPDHRHLMHFNKRSSHNTPYSKSLKCYNSWEKDDSESRQEPYIECFPGDVIPSYGVVTRSQLDKQLEDYRKNKGKPECLIQTESDDETEKDERDYNDVFVEYISESEKDQILERDFYNRYFGDSEGDFDEEDSSDETEYEEDSEDEKSVMDDESNEKNTQNVKDNGWVKCENGIETDYEYIENYNGSNETMTSD